MSALSSRVAATSTTDGTGRRQDSASESSSNIAMEEAEVLHGDRWHLLAGALTLEEQVRLFGFIRELDVTNWEELVPCMNPTPKTLELTGQGGRSARVIGCDPNGKTAVVEMVTKAIGMLQWHTTIKSITVAAIRYCASGGHPWIGSCFPPHVDHCNDGSWVVLFSLGRTATFHIQTRGMAQRHTFAMNSGDVLVFDPSTEAAIVHGVADVLSVGEEDSELSDRFNVLRSSRFGVQCRVMLNE